MSEETFLPKEKEYQVQISALEDRAQILEEKLNRIKIQSDDVRRPILIYLQGQIGVGKTTLGHALASKIDGAKFVPEPLTVKIYNKILSV